MHRNKLQISVIRLSRDFYSLCFPFTHKPVVLCLHFFALPHGGGSQWHTKIAVAHCVATVSLLAAQYSAYYHFRSKCWSCQLKCPTDQAARKFCELQRTQVDFYRGMVRDHNLFGTSFYGSLLLPS